MSYNKNKTLQERRSAFFKYLRVDTSSSDDPHPVRKLDVDHHLIHWEQYSIRKKNISGRTSPLRKEVY